MKVLVAYATSYGSTAAIASHIADRLRGRGAEVTVADVSSLGGTNAESFDAIAVGGRVWGNRYPRRMSRFVVRNLGALQSRTSAFFSVCLWNVSRLEAHRLAARDVPVQFLTRVGWTPDEVEVIAGTLAFSRYGFGVGFLGRRLMQRIWKNDVGLLDTGRDYAFTDWGQVGAFADRFFYTAEARLGGRSSTKR